MITVGKMSHVKAVAALAATVQLVCTTQAAHAQADTTTQPASPEVQIFTLVARAEHVARKCDAFTLEGQFLYQEFKGRLLNSFNRPLFDSISAGQAPMFSGTCRDLSKRPEAQGVVDYFNSEGVRMLALHAFLPEDSPCTYANTPAVRQRAAAAWSKLSPSQDPRLQPAAMQAEADMIASQCNLSDAQGRARAHAAAFMAETLKPVYERPATYRGEMTVKGTREDSPTFVEAVRDSGAQIVKGGVMAGLTRSIGVGNEVLILRDGRLAVVEEGDSSALLGMATVEFHAGGKTYSATQARTIDPRFVRIFILDSDASKAVLGQPSFGIGFVDPAGASTMWEESYEYRGRKRTDRGTSVRPVRFDTTAFKAALQYANAPAFGG